MMTIESILERPERQTQRNTRILIVDDKPENIFALQSVLEEEGRDFESAGSGTEALKKLIEQRFDLVLLDVQMPGMNGFEVADILKSNKATGSIPIIFITAINKDEKYVVKGYKAGAVDYLFKPLNYQVTRAKVDACLRLYKKQTELEEKNAKLKNLETLVQHSADAMCILESTDYTIREHNTAFAHLLKKYQINGHKLHDLVSEEESDLLQKAFKVLNLKNRGCDFETKGVFTSPHNWHSWRAVYNNGYWYMNIRDITAIKWTEEKLKDQNQRLEKTNAELDKFIYSASHDLRAPLASVQGLINVAKLERNPVDAHTCLNLIEGQIKKLDNFIQDIIYYSRNVKQDIVYNDINLLQQTEECLSNYSGNPLFHRLEKRRLIPPDTIIKTDRMRLSIILNNLISNAIKYQNSNQANPYICISSEEREDCFKIHVEDNGIGIDARHQNAIFDMFYRASELSQGAGLGLYIVKETVEKLNGTIEVDSLPWKGTTFTFTLPRIV